MELFSALCGMIGGLFGRGEKKKKKFRIKINSWTEEHTVDVHRGGEFGDTASLKVTGHWARFHDHRHQICCNWVQR